MKTQPTLASCRCPRCGGPMYVDYHDAACCLLCGEYIFLDQQSGPVTPPVAGPKRRRQQRRGDRPTVAA